MYNKISVKITMILIITATLTVPSSVLQFSHAQGDIENTILNTHNQERANVQVPALSWSNSLAADAQQYADHLVSLGLSPDDIAPHAQGTGQGENLAWGPSNSFTTDELAQGWYAEKSNFQPGHIMSQGDFAPGVPMIGHYTQIVWKDTTEVGCAEASSDSTEYLVCRYSPPGNYLGQTPF